MNIHMMFGNNMFHPNAKVPMWAHIVLIKCYPQVDFSFLGDFSQLVNIEGEVNPTWDVFGKEYEQVNIQIQQCIHVYHQNSYIQPIQRPLRGRKTNLIALRGENKLQIKEGHKVSSYCTTIITSSYNVQHMQCHVIEATCNNLSCVYHVISMSFMPHHGIATLCPCYHPIMCVPC